MGRSEKERDVSDSDVMRVESEGGGVYKVRTKATRENARKDAVAELLGGQFDSEIIHEVESFK